MQGGILNVMIQVTCFSHQASFLVYRQEFYIPFLLMFKLHILIMLKVMKIQMEMVFVITN